jgi:thiol-disulfide isomerase/thioredoxin
MIRWTIAAVAALALALLTLPSLPDLPFGHDDLAAAAPGTSACPANAKPANLNFTVKDLNNKEIKLSSLKGKVILLDFWATWCGPCKIEIPWFIEFHNKYAKSGLAVVGVLTEDTPAKARPFAEQWKMNYTIVDGNNRDDLDDAFGPMFGLPVTVVISRDGKVCSKHIGLSSKETFEKEIKSLL